MKTRGIELMLCRRVMLLLFLLSVVSDSWGGSASSFVPDPLNVQAYGKGYRYTQKGWTVLHIEGTPYERGIQHGRLMAPEISEYIRCLSLSSDYKSPVAAWTYIRQLTGVLMLKHYPEDLREEMQGIADGASEAGARAHGRRLDIVDIAAINASNEIDLLGDAMKATPTGMEGFRAPEDKPSLKRTQSPKRARPGRCSAFAANGVATPDGKIVLGHITMYDLYQAAYYNVWIDVKPEQGFRFMMQSTPGGVHSGMDFILNESGLVLSETTIQQTACDPSGIPLAVRIRRASQYADSIESAAEILSSSGNGLCSTEWILADTKRNEIALLTLGMKAHKLHRGSRGEWIGGTEGFFWSCNNAKDLEVRMETAPGVQGRPSSASVFEPSKRDSTWAQMYERFKGKMDESFAVEALSTPALVSACSVDAVYTTASLVERFQVMASFGPPAGKVWNPSFSEKTRFPEIRPLIQHPWTRIEGNMTLEARSKDAAGPADLHDPSKFSQKEMSAHQRKESEPETLPAWRGTLLPLTASDVWLPLAFSNYEKVVALESACKVKSGTVTLSPDHLEEIGVETNFYRTEYALGAVAGGDKSLSALSESLTEENWHRIASGKGTLFLHTLRGLLGSNQFEKLMDEFGHKNAGQRVGKEMFRAFLEKETGRRLDSFFNGWLESPGLARVRISNTSCRRSAGGWVTTVKVTREGEGGAPLVPITVETAEDGEENVATVLENVHASVDVQTSVRPVRVILDKYGTASCVNEGAPFTILTFDAELEKTLIVYGTLDEEAGNHEAARLLQLALRRREHNTSVVIRSDKELSEEELSENHLILIGRPSCNALSLQWANSLPVRFGTASFEVREEYFAHPDSAVICAAANPMNKRYSVVCIAGMSCGGTLRVVPFFEQENLSYAHVVILAHDREAQPTTIPAADMVKILR